MTRTPQDRADDRLSPAAGETAPPGTGLAAEVPGTPPLADTRPVASGGPDVTTDPRAASPCSGRAGAGASADGAGAPAEPLTGDEWRRKVKAATSAKNADRRRQRGRYTRVADRTPGDQYGPGMARRPPPPSGDDAA